MIRTFHYSVFIAATVALGLSVLGRGANLPLDFPFLKAVSPTPAHLEVTDWSLMTTSPGATPECGRTRSVLLCA
jgi:hypothetical protein